MTIFYYCVQPALPNIRFYAILPPPLIRSRVPKREQTIELLQELAKTWATKLHCRRTCLKAEDVKAKGGLFDIHNHRAHVQTVSDIRIDSLHQRETIKGESHMREMFISSPHDEALRLLPSLDQNLQKGSPKGGS